MSESPSTARKIVSAIAVALFCLLVWLVIRELGKPPPPPRIEPGATPALQSPGVGQ